MKLVLGIVIALACAGAIFLALDSRGGSAPSAPSPIAPHEDATPRIAELERAVAALTDDVRRLEVELSRAAPTRVRADDGPPPIEATEATRGAGRDAHEPRWYLEEYRRSFATSPAGSAFYRRQVETFAFEIVDEIGVLVRDAREPFALRANLVAILGDARFARNARAYEPVLWALQRAGAENPPFAQACLACIAAIGDAQAAASLERCVWTLEPIDVRRAALATLVRLLGADANRALRRLLDSAPGDADRIAILQLIDKSDADAALEILRAASGLEVAVRAAAAQATGQFRGKAFEAFVEQWLTVETDEGVSKILNGTLAKLTAPPRWGVEQVLGAPNAALGRDDDKAWTYERPNMGAVSLQVGFQPQRAHEVRIHESYAPGAITEVTLFDENGGSRVVFSGADPTTKAGVFTCAFPTTDQRIRAVRIVLDTNRVPTWCEIDAVELLGPEGSQWASEASASSSYGK